MSRKLFAYFMLIPCLSWAELGDNVQDGIDYSGTVMAPVNFEGPDVYGLPVELQVPDTPDCHVFGYLLREDPAASPSAMTGVLKRLVCKEADSFVIWNVRGPIESFSATESKTRPEDGVLVVSVLADSTLNFKIDERRARRLNNYIYLYDSELGTVPVKIFLNELVSFGAEAPIDDELPELLD